MNWKNVSLGVLLVGIAVVGPMVAYAGITAIYPNSTTTLGVDATPPITFDQGADYATAANIGFAASWDGDNNNASYTIDLNGLAGGNVTIDELTNITVESSVSSFRMNLTGGATDADITTLKLRLWTGGTAPTGDGDAQVCSYLDLTASDGTLSTGTCGSGSLVRMQFEYVLAAEGTVAESITIRPDSIVWA